MAEWETVARELVAERYGALVGYARLVTGGPGAEELLKDALLVAFSSPRGLTSVPVAETRVRRAVVTRFLAGARRSSRARRATPPAADVAVAGHDLASALRTLTPRERACVVLRHLEAMSVPQTAATLGIAQGAAQRSLADGLAKLNVALGTDETPDDPIIITAPRSGAR